VTETTTTTGVSRRTYQRTIPTFLVSVLAGILLIHYFAPQSASFDSVHAEITQWGTILTAISFVYGYISILLIHARRLYFRRAPSREIFGSVIVFCSFLIIMGIQFGIPGGIESDFSATWQFYLIGFANTAVGIDWAFHPFACVRMFRVTSVEAAVMFLSWMFACLSVLPAWTNAIPALGTIGDWIGQVPMTATMRAGLACTGVSSVVLCVRALVGREPGLIEVEAL
jgi:hypothetical protein